VSKAAYVLAQPNDGRHLCHWPGCAQRVPAAMWGCRQHWFALPLGLRNQVWAAYRPGQEVTKTPSLSYVEVARQVQAWIAARDLL
jgi:hypothetical protein